MSSAATEQAHQGGWRDGEPIARAGRGPFPSNQCSTVPRCDHRYDALLFQNAHTRAQARARRSERAITLQQLTQAPRASGGHGCAVQRLGTTTRDAAESTAAAFPDRSCSEGRQRPNHLRKAVAGEDMRGKRIQLSSARIQIRRRGSPLLGI